MKLPIDGQPQNLIPLPTFRANLRLPEQFSLDFFEQKAWQGLGSMVGAGPQLTALKERILAAVPSQLTPPQLLAIVPLLTQLFEQELTAINADIGLAAVEVDFAVAGFQDVLQAVAFRLVQLTHTPGAETTPLCRQFDFDGVYQQWLDDSVRVASRQHLYQTGNQTLAVQTIYYAYGRVGMRVTTANQIYYVADPSLACPAAGFMFDLCAQASQLLCQALSR